LDKFEPDGDHGTAAEEHHGLSDGQKKAIKAGVAIAVVGGLMLYGHQQTAAMKGMAGKSISASQFKKNVGASKLKTWGLSGYIQPSSHLREEFELPAGHTFHRISTTAEKTFSGGTYATHSTEDFHRYVSAFRQEKGSSTPLHHVTFTANQPIKIPSLATTLETIREHLTEVNGAEATAKEAHSYYQSISGGSWSSMNAAKIGKRLAAKGYHGIVDEMDAGVIGESPLVLFTSAQHLFSAKVSNPLSAEAIKTAESSLIELTNRKL
jgi:hypothetical protein